MKKIKLCFLLSLVTFCLINLSIITPKTSFADTAKKYFTVYDENEQVLFLKGDDISTGDRYLSHDNKMYEITSVDENKKSARAKYLFDEKLPEYKVTSSKKYAKAATKKLVGVYHTHNDESYFTPDGTDSI